MIKVEQHVLSLAAQGYGLPVSRWDLRLGALERSPDVARSL